MIFTRNCLPCWLNKKNRFFKSKGEGLGGSVLIVNREGSDLCLLFKTNSKMTDFCEQLQKRGRKIENFKCLCWAYIYKNKNEEILEASGISTARPIFLHV